MTEQRKQWQKRYRAAYKQLRLDHPTMPPKWHRHQARTRADMGRSLAYVKELNRENS